ncbi:MAG: zinc-ribbon domain-containing protein [Clostridia bacterium]
MEDKTLVCKDCGKEFVFTVGEQQFYQEKGFTNEPQRCPDCRKAKKMARNSNRRSNY